MNPNKTIKLLWLGSLLLGVLIAAVYSNSLRVPFVFDDIGYIQGNRHIKDLSNFKSLWTALDKPSRFIGILTFALNYHFGRYDVFGYHLFNIAVHIANALLVWWFARLLFLTPWAKEKYPKNPSIFIGFCAALFFSLHPLNTQAVTYVCQRFASMATMFYLLCLCFYLKARFNGKRRLKTGFYALSAMAALLGMFTKQIVLTLPVMIILIEAIFFLKPGELKKNSRRYVILAGVLLAFFAIIPVVYIKSIVHLLTLESDSGSHRGDVFNSFTYALTQLRVVATYLRLYVFPINQNLLYDFTVSKSLFELNTFLCFTLLLTVFFLAVFAYQRDRFLGFAVFWMYLTLLVESSFIPIRHVIFEHRMYLPSVGLSIGLSVLLWYLMSEKKKHIAAAVILAVAMSFLTFQRNRVWQDPFVLWRDGIKKSPEKSRPYMNTANAYLGLGDYTKAIAYYDMASEKNPTYERIYNNRGTAYILSGYPQRGIEDLNKAIELMEGFDQAYINRGNAYDRLGKIDLAIADYSKVLESNPDNIQALINRANKYTKLNANQKALDDYTKALSLDATNVAAYKNRARLYRKMKAWEKAQSDYTKAIELDPEDMELRFLLVNMHQRADNFKQAQRVCEEILAIDPKNAKAYFEKGNAEYLMKDYDAAIASYSRAVELDVSFPTVYYHRALTYYQKRNIKKALDDAQQASELGFKVPKHFLKKLGQHTD